MKKLITLLLIVALYSCSKDKCQTCIEYTTVETQYPYQHDPDIVTTESTSQVCGESEISQAEETKTTTAEGHDKDYPYIKTTVITTKRSICN